MNCVEIAVLVRMPRLLDALGFAVNECNRRCACQLHGGSNPTTFSWGEDGRWFCFLCGKGGDRIALVRAVRRCSFREAVAFLAALAGIRPSEACPSQGEIELARRERKQQERVAGALVEAERSALAEARENLDQLLALRRKVSKRLHGIESGLPERWPSEAEWGWEALRFVSDELPRADAAYCVAAFAAPAERYAFALHPERRADLIASALERGFVCDAKGYRFEVPL